MLSCMSRHSLYPVIFTYGILKIAGCTYTPRSDQIRSDQIHSHSPKDSIHLLRLPAENYTLNLATRVQHKRQSNNYLCFILSRMVFTRITCERMVYTLPQARCYDYVKDGSHEPRDLQAYVFQDG
jgi:hypothetical protein